ncbi:cytochrome P450 [Cubamyces sp. BRFM 1775]|nr:cytochrome P450 [Cubamyces sp. BRFM 1775]
MASPSNSQVLLAAALPVVALVTVYVRSFFKWRARTRGRPLPPGPRPWPIVGNLFDLPRFKPWRKCLEFTEQYGSIVYLQVLGEPMIIVGDPDVAHELLNKRSANTADRPRNPIVELSGQDVNFAVLPYGEWWRRHRRSFWQQFNPNVTSRYLSIQREGAHKFLASILASPSRLRTNIY